MRYPCNTCIHMLSPTAGLLPTLKILTPNVEKVDLEDECQCASGEVPRGEKMLYSGTDPESYITEYTSVYENKRIHVHAYIRV